MLYYKGIVQLLPKLGQKSSGGKIMPNNTTAPDMLEYALLVALIALVFILAIVASGGPGEFFKEVATGLANF